MTYEHLKHSLELCARAYDDEQTYCPCRIHTIDDMESGIQCYIRVYENSLKIAFRGTDTAEDRIRDLRFWKKKIPYGNYSSKIRVHSGFIDAYKSKRVREEIHEQITDNIRHIEVSGHSLGAAMAVLCAIDINYNFPHVDLEAVLFGCPRVGNRAFARSYNNRVFKTFRVENNNDVVTKIPPAVFGYHHVGIPIHIGAIRLPFWISFVAHWPREYYKNLMKKT